MRAVLGFSPLPAFDPILPRGSRLKSIAPHTPFARPARFFGSFVAAAAVLFAMQTPAPAPSFAEPHRLADTTIVDSWQLQNGLRVVTRDIRRAPGVSVTLAFGTGSEQDPQGREGRALLLAHAAFLSAAGEFPQRSLAELEKARPLGWRIEVGRRHTRLTEVATIEQFPGVLHQFAQRLGSLKPAAPGLAAAKKGVTSQLSENYRGQLAVALSYQVRELGAPGGYEGALAYAAGKGVEAATLREVQDALGALYIPANAVLSLAGNLSGSGIEVKRAIEGEFGGIAGGTRAPETPAQPIVPGFKIVERTGIDRPFGVIGLIAPALSDTTHPSFYMHSLLVGAHLIRGWGRSEQIPSPFQYSLLDDPEMLRFYPPITPSDVDSLRIRESYNEGILALSRTAITRDEYSQLHASVVWMLGGPMNLDLRPRARTDPGVLAALSTTAAMRELWGGEAFWAPYRERFIAVDRPEFARWSDYFLSPGHQVQVMFAPEYLIPK